MPMTVRLTVMALASGLLLYPTARAADVTATMNKVTPKGIGEEVGTVRMILSHEGAVFNLNLKGLPPGLHGMHIHEKGDCGPAVNDGTRSRPARQVDIGTAGHAGKHEGPNGQGHIGRFAGAGGSSRTVPLPRASSRRGYTILKPCAVTR